VFQIFLHQCKLRGCVGEISATRTKNGENIEATLDNGGCGERVARSHATFAKRGTQLNAVGSALACGDARIQPLRAYLEDKRTTQI
jgi:hypothetical protein